MITVTRLDGTEMVVNSDQIAWIEYHPDTVISLNSGEKLIVRESPETLVERVKAFRRAIMTDLRLVERCAPDTSDDTAQEAW
jgi:flagellar protein FlbD